MEIKINQSSTAVKFGDLSTFNIFVFGEQIYIKYAIEGAIKVNGKYTELFSHSQLVFPCKKVEVTI